MDVPASFEMELKQLSRKLATPKVSSSFALNEVEFLGAQYSR